MIKDYSSAEKTSPDRPETPPFDGTGHINAVQASTPNQRIDSGANPDLSIMKKLNKDLIKTSAASVSAQNTAEKKQSNEDID